MRGFIKRVYGALTDDLIADANGTSIFCTGTKSQQIFRRFKPNMNYYIDVFGVHPNLSHLTFHLGSHRMWHSNKNFTISLTEGRTGQGKLSQLNDLVTFSYKVRSSCTSPSFPLIILVPLLASQHKRQRDSLVHRSLWRNGDGQDSETEEDPS